MPDFKVQITGDGATLVRAAKDSADALKSTGEAAANLTDEAERYSDALRKMAINQKAAEQSQRSLADESERYQATLERMAQSQAEAERSSASQEERLGGAEAKAAAAQRLTESKKRIAEVDKEIADGVIVVGEEEVKAAEKAQTAGSRSLEIKGQLRQAVKGLALEFPGLARVAAMALNPVTIAIAAIVSAFAILQERMRNAQQVLAGFEMPDVSDDRLKKYERAATAWETFAENVQKAVEAYNSVIEASDRVEKAIDRQAEREKKRLANQERMELAALELRKSKMSETQHAAEKARIEGMYEQGQMAIEDRAQKRKLDERGRKVANLEISAENKLREAGRMHPADENREASVEEKYRESAEEAVRSKKEAKKALDRLIDMRADPMERAKGTWWYAMRYGPYKTGSEAMEYERDNMHRADVAIDQYDNFMLSKERRKRQRSRQGSLLDEASKEAAAAYTTSRDLSIDNYNFNQDRRLNRETLEVNSFERTVGVAATGAGEAAKLQSAAVEAIESGRSLSAAMIRALESVSEENKKTAAALEYKIGTLAERAANMRG